MKIIRFIMIVLFVSLLSADYAGGYTGSALRLGVSARDISLSGSMVSVYNQGFSSFSNPALISKTDGVIIGSSLFSLVANNVNMQVFSIARDLPPNAGAGLSVVHIGVPNIIGIDQNEQLTQNLSFHDSYVMMSFGVNFSKYLSIGVNTKALFQRFSISDNETLSSNGISFDIGLFSSPVENLNIGIKVNNISGKYKWEENENSIPAQFISGVSYSPNESLLLLLQHELIDINQEYLSHRSSFGAEYRIDKSIPIFIRCGLKQTQWAIINDELKDNLVKATGGFGIEFESFNKSTINLDYAIEFNQIGASNLISISAKL